MTLVARTKEILAAAGKATKKAICAGFHRSRGIFKGSRKLSSYHRFVDLGGSLSSSAHTRLPISMAERIDKLARSREETQAKVLRDILCGAWMCQNVKARSIALEGGMGSQLRKHG